MSVAAPPSPTPLDVAGGSQLGRRFDALCAGWRGPVLAALVVLVSALPGLLALPPLDRDESRFAEASAQMLETGDYVNIRFQNEPRDKKPVGIYWLQALSARLISSDDLRDVRPYRLPSLLGAMLAAAACAWGAGAAFGARGGLIAGGVLGASLLLSSEAFVGKTDAVLCGATTLAMAGLGRLYLAAQGARTDEETGVGWRERSALWTGLALGVLDKGPVTPMVLGLTLTTLALVDRRRRQWIGGLGWRWGWLLPLGLVAPWAFAVTVATDGTFWSGMQGDIAPKLTSAHQAHGGLPGTHALLAPLLLFPSSFLLPAAAVAAWTRRGEPAVRFALAWLIPSWLVFEIAPTKLIHYPLPLYGALAWLIAAAVTSGPIDRRVRCIGAALAIGAGVAVAAVPLLATERFGGGSASTWLSALAVSGLALAAGASGGWFLWKDRPARGLAAAGAAGVLAHMLLTGMLAPSLTPLWVSNRAAALLQSAGLDPRDGRTVGPVAVAGYAEPSLVFALGADTELDPSGADAAEALAAGSPAFVEARQEAAFTTTLAKRGAVARSAGDVAGFDYSAGRDVRLTLWRPIRLPPPAPQAETAIPSTVEESGS